MKRLQHAVLVLDLAKELMSKGSWCGETHLQKALYFLIKLLDVPLDFEFTLYKHGPFSFDFRDELAALLADNLIELEIQYPYGPRIKPSEFGEKLMGKFPRTLGKYQSEISWLAEQLGNSGVVDLEQLGTALYVSRDSELEGKDSEEIIDRIIELKPHITKEEAQRALEKVRELEKEAAELFN